MSRRREKTPSLPVNGEASRKSELSIPGPRKGRKAEAPGGSKEGVRNESGNQRTVRTSV